MKGEVKLVVEVTCSPEDGYVCHGEPTGPCDEVCCAWYEYDEDTIIDCYGAPSGCHHAAGLYGDGICSNDYARLAADQLYEAAQKEGEV